MCKEREWKFIVGHEGHDRWVMISPDEKIFIIGEWKSENNKVFKSIRIEYNESLLSDEKGEKQCAM